MSDRLFYLAIAVIVITAWMMRWEIVPSSGTEDESLAHFKLNRLTGDSYLCARETCFKNKDFDND